jgi:hypothetical protein
VNGEKQYQVMTAKRFAAFGNFDDVHISRAWETIRDNIYISAKGSMGASTVKQALSNQRSPPHHPGLTPCADEIIGNNQC